MPAEPPAHATTQAAPRRSPLRWRSEVGVLRRVILHRPDLELKRLTPRNKDALLFDDVLWVKRARQEHDAFADALAERGVEVLYLQRAAGRALLGRRRVRDEVLDAHARGGGARAAPARPRCASGSRAVGPTELASSADRRHHATTSCRSARPRWPPRSPAPDDFVLPPLPNHLFTRDTSAWIYDGVSVNAMAKPARRREAVHLDAIYRHHPLFASSRARLERRSGRAGDRSRAATCS